jgi:solute carrier family 25 iron transporter 28/37
MSYNFAAHAVYFSVYEQSKSYIGADKLGHHPARAAICGALAALSHDLIMTPFDTIKQRMQLGHFPNMLSCFRSTIASEGAKALYVSLPTTLLMNIPYGCIMVSVNESARKFLSPSGKNHSASTLVSGALAGAIAAILTNPLDVIKTRLQIQKFEPSSFYIGSCIQNGSISCPSAVINPPLRPNAVGGQSTSAPCTSAWQMSRQIFREQGMFGFTRGAFARVLVHSPSVAISWTAYESVKRVLISS